MFYFKFRREKFLKFNRTSAERACALYAIRIQILPKFVFHAVAVIVRGSEFFEFFGYFQIFAAVFTLLRKQLPEAFRAERQLARRLDSDHIRPAVNRHKFIVNFPELV